MIKTPQTGVNLYVNEMQINLDDIIPPADYEHQLYWYTSISTPKFPADTRVVAVSVISTQDDDGTFGSGCAVRLADYNIGLTTDADYRWKWRCIFVADGSAPPASFWEEAFDDSAWVRNISLVFLRFVYEYITVRSFLQGIFRIVNNGSTFTDMCLHA